MKKIVVGFFSIILVNLLIVLAFNINIKYVVSDLITNSGIHDSINNIIGSYFNNKNITVIKQDEASEFVNDFLKILIEDSGDTSDFLVNIINKKRENIKKYNISDDEIDRVIYEIEANISVNKNFEDNISEKQKIGLVAYKIASSTKLRNYLLMGIILCLIILLIIDKFNVFKDIGLSFLGAGFLIKICCILIDSFLASDNYESMLSNIKINLSYLDKYIYGYIVMGLVLFGGYIIYIIVNKDKKALI